MCRTGGRQIWFNYFDALELKNIFWNTAPQAAVSHRLYTSEYQNGSEVASSRWLVPLPFPPKNMIIFPIIFRQSQHKRNKSICDLALVTEKSRMTGNHPTPQKDNGIPGAFYKTSKCIGSK